MARPGTAGEREADLEVKRNNASGLKQGINIPRAVDDAYVDDTLQTQPTNRALDSLALLQLGNDGETVIVAQTATEIHKPIPNTAINVARLENDRTLYAKKGAQIVITIRNMTIPLRAPET